MDMRDELLKVLGLGSLDSVTGAIISTLPLEFEKNGDEKGRLLQSGSCEKLYIYLCFDVIAFYMVGKIEPSMWKEVVRASVRFGVKKILFLGAGEAANTDEGYDGCVLIDHINLSGFNPLIGKNDDLIGLRFPDVSDLYSCNWRGNVERAFAEKGFNLTEGNLLVPKDMDSRTFIEKLAIEKGKVKVISQQIFSGAITAKHAGCMSSAVLFFNEKRTINFHMLCKYIFA